MKTMSLQTRIISGLIAGGLVLSTAGIAFATTNTTSAPRLTNPITAELKTAVSSNIITQAESDKIIAYITSKTPATDKGPKIGIKGPDLFDELVSSNILTQTKADALKASEEAQRDAQRQLDLKTKITTLVTDKTLTQAQADSITVAIKANETLEKVAREAEKTKTDAMTDAQRKTYMESKVKSSKVNPLKALVTDGTITQAEADKVNALLPGGPGHGGPGKGGPGHDGKGRDGKGHGENKATTTTGSPVTAE